MSAVPDLEASVAAIRGLFDAAACSCALADESGEMLEFVAANGIGAEEIVGVRIPVTRGIVGGIALSGQPISVRDVQADARFARDVAESTRYVPTHILAAPMLDPQGEVVGVVEVLDPRVGEASDWSIAVLGTLASQLAVIAARVGPAEDPLAALGAEVLRVVRRFDGPGSGRP